MPMRSGGAKREISSGFGRGGRENRRAPSRIEHRLCRMVLALTLVVVAVIASAPEAQAARPQRLYLALGDSIAFGIGASDPSTKGYAGQLFQTLRAPGKWQVDSLRNLSNPVNETSSSILGNQLSAALEAIEDPTTDTRVVTLGIGGNDVGFDLLTHGPCATPAVAACGFVANYRTLLRRLTNALGNDPGREALVVVTYYNPLQGTDLETSFDDAVVGSDRRVDCSGKGKRVGLNDLLACLGRRFGARVADIYPPLTGRIPELSAAGTHLNDDGYALVAKVIGRALQHPRLDVRAAASALVQAGAPGAIALVAKGKRTKLATAGAEVLAQPGRPRGKDRFRAGSVTKSFVATLVLQLVQKHRLRLNDSVERWLPGLLPNGDQITIKELLDHRSGLFDYTSDPSFFGGYLAGTRPLGYRWSERQLVALGTSHPPVFPPGTAAAYSNTNYIVLGMVIEAATHHSLPYELRRRITSPLHLRSTSLKARAPTGRYLHGYITPAGVLAPGRGGLFDTGALNASLAGAAGGLLTSAPDLARFYRALFAGRIIGRRLLSLMRSPLSPLATLIAKQDGYGLGLARFRYRCGTVWGHDGDYPGYITLALASRPGRRAVVIAINTDSITLRLAQAISSVGEDLYCGG